MTCACALLIDGPPAAVCSRDRSGRCWKFENGGGVSDRGADRSAHATSRHQTVARFPRSDHPFDERATMCVREGAQMTLEHDHAAHEHEDDHAGHDHGEHGGHEHVEYPDAVAAYRAQKDEYFRSAHGSPIPAAERDAFTGLPYFPVDEGLRFEGLSLEPYTGNEPVLFQIPTSDGQLREADRAGVFRFDK